MYRAPSAATSLLLAWGCSQPRRDLGTAGDGATGGAAIGDLKPFLDSSARRAPNPLATIPKKDLAAAINQQGYIYLTKPRSNSETDCNDKLFGALKAVVNGSLLVIDGETDIDECRPGDNAGSGSLKDVKFRVLLYVNCKDTPLDQYQGQSLRDLREFHTLCEEGTFLLNQKMEGTLSLSLDGLEVTANLEIVDGMMNSAGLACAAEKQGDGFSWQNCYRFSRQVYSGVQASGKNADKVNEDSLFPNSIFEIKHSNSVYQRSSDQFFSEGEAAFRLNQWRGTIEYSGATRAPKWTSTLSGETAKGEFSGR